MWVSLKKVALTAHDETNEIFTALAPIVWFLLVSENKEDPAYYYVGPRKLSFAPIHLY
jgi:hypothetical protein